jgi:ABC-type sugar transport system ATPase subunit
MSDRQADLWTGGTRGASTSDFHLEVHEFSRRFGATVALDRVSLGVRGGEIHALLGANGSGKSTMVKCLSGVDRPDSGTIDLMGTHRAGFSRPSEAAALGIGVVHQHSPLINTSTVAENIGVQLGFPRRRGLVSERLLKAQACEVMESINLHDVSPSAMAGDLGAGTRALIAVAIAQAKIQGGRLLIIDEVTASMAQGAAERFLGGVRELANRGLGVLMVTHRLPEVVEYADRATVLTSGVVTQRASGAALTSEALAEAIGAGKELDMASAAAVRGATRSKAVADGRGLEIRALAGQRLLPLTVTCRPGEVTGIVGSTASGLNELAGILGGWTVPSAGSVTLHGHEVAQGRGPRHALHMGIAVLPADRLADGGMHSMSVGANVLLPVEGRYWSPRRRRAAVDALISELDVRPSRSEALLGSLSGGNQQKVGLAKWLLTEPEVLVLDDPTNGVDAASRQKLLQAFRRQASRGLTMLLMSTEPEIVAGFCDRVYLIESDGSIRELAAADGRKTEITLAMMG